MRVGRTPNSFVPKGHVIKISFLPIPTVLFKHYEATNFTTQFVLKIRRARQMISMDMGFDDPFWQKALAPDGVKQTIGTVLSDPPSCIIMSRTLSIMSAPYLIHITMLLWPSVEKFSRFEMTVAVMSDKPAQASEASGGVYEEIRKRHSLRTASRFSSKFMRLERDLCEKVIVNRRLS